MNLCIRKHSVSITVMCSCWISLILLIGFVINYRSLPLDNVKYWGTHWGIFLLHMVSSDGENEVKKELSWQEHAPGPLSYGAETKNDALNGPKEEETMNLAIVWRVRKSLGRSWLASASGSLMSFTEEQLCYTAHGVDSCTSFSSPLWESNCLKANKYCFFFFSVSKCWIHWYSPFHSALYLR